MSGLRIDTVYIVQSHFGVRVFLTRVRAVAWATRKAGLTHSAHTVLRQDIGAESDEPKDGTFAWAEPTPIVVIEP